MVKLIPLTKENIKNNIKKLKNIKLHYNTFPQNNNNTNCILFVLKLKDLYTEKNNIYTLPILEKNWAFNLDKKKIKLLAKILLSYNKDIVILPTKNLTSGCLVFYKTTNNAKFFNHFAITINENYIIHFWEKKKHIITKMKMYFSKQNIIKKTKIFFIKKK